MAGDALGVGVLHVPRRVDGIVSNPLRFLERRRAAGQRVQAIRVSREPGFVPPEHHAVEFEKLRTCKPRESLICQRRPQHVEKAPGLPRGQAHPRVCQIEHLLAELAYGGVALVQ
eukprot:1749298-Pyramimonas_sp.AAC.1